MPLTSEELTLMQDVGFAPEIAELIKRHAGKTLERLLATKQDGGYEPVLGISVAVEDGEEAERLITAMTTSLSARGYRAFWSERHHPNGLRETNEVAFLRTNDPFAMVRLRRSDGANYNVFTDDIIDRLTSWMQVCSFEAIGASRDWVALQFSTLPEKICAFAEDMYLFCPDTVTQGVGFTARNDTKRIAESRKLCPEVSPRVMRQDSQILSAMGELVDDFQDLLRNEVETGVRLLADELQRTRYIFLWWD